MHYAERKREAAQQEAQRAQKARECAHGCWDAAPEPSVGSVVRGGAYYTGETALEFAAGGGLGLSDPDTSVHPLAGDSQMASDYDAFKAKFGRTAKVAEGAALMKYGGRPGKVIGAVVILGAIVFGGEPEVNGTQGEQGNFGPDKGGRDPLPAQKDAQGQSKLLPGEGKAGTFSELKKAGSVGDDLTPHHMPANDYMEKAGPPEYTRGEGIAMNMEQPKVGGRHRETASYGRESDTSLKPREALAQAVRDARSVYQKAGAYTAEIREGLQKVIRENKVKWGDFFKKVEQVEKQVK